MDPSQTALQLFIREEVPFCKRPVFIFEKPNLQTRINIAGSSTLWEITGDIYEIAPLSTFRTDIRRDGCRYEESAFSAFPVGQTASGTDVAQEFPRSRVATVGTHPFFLFFFHFFLSFRKARCLCVQEQQPPSANSLPKGSCSVGGRSYYKPRANSNLPTASPKARLKPLMSRESFRLNDNIGSIP